MAPRMSGSDEIQALVRRLHAVAVWLRDDVRRWEAARDRRAVFGYAYAMRGSQRERSAPFKLQPGVWVREFPGLRARARRQRAPFKRAPGPSAPSRGANSPNRDVLDSPCRQTLRAAKTRLVASFGRRGPRS